MALMAHGTTAVVKWNGVSKVVSSCKNGKNIFR